MKPRGDLKSFRGKKDILVCADLLSATAGPAAPSGISSRFITSFVRASAAALCSLTRGDNIFFCCYLILMAVSQPNNNFFFEKRNNLWI